MEAAAVVQEGVFYFNPQDGIYADHFPSHPVVPGSLIIQAFLDLAGSVRQIEEFRFRSFLVPGRYRYRLTRRDNGWDCLLLENEQIMVRGKLKG
jgi:3-hydroxyacyl-[acyl-carrier-protein] dehydratase